MRLPDHKIIPNSHSMKTQKSSVFRKFSISAAFVVLTSMAVHAETINVPAGTALALRVGIDENSYNLQGNWGEPPEGGDAKLVAPPSGGTTVTGSITVNLFDDIQSVQSSDVTIEGGISGSGAATSYLMLNPAGGSSITVQKNPITLPLCLDGLIIFGDPGHQGTVILNVASNSWGGAIIQEGATLQTTVANALAPNATLMVHGKLDLNGKDQAVGPLGDDLPGGALPGSTGGLITSTAAATLTVDQADLSFPDKEGGMQSSKGNFSGGITGAASLIKQGPGTLNLGGASDTSGTIAVQAGTLSVKGTLKAHSLSAGKGARLAVRVGGAAPAITAGDVSIAGSDLDLIISDAGSPPGDKPIFLIVSQGTVTGTFKTVSLNGGAPIDANNIPLNGKKFRLVYNGRFSGAGSDGSANDIALMPMP
ncbi:MAG: autotransporter-associated beta strand repeat-containing protein [Verrucomicrobia bacterium]|nr:autotransporter-associated beta strand repeat-containing protein [Verrucomicrobiota bacterium]